MSDSRTLLILSGGIEAVAGIATAKEMGLNVIVMDGNPECPGHDLGDTFIEANIYDSDAVVAALRNYGNTAEIDGVITIAADNTKSVAAANQFLGLTGISDKTAHIATDKLAQKRIFKLSGLPIPWFSHVESVGHLKEIFKSNPMPMVLKPTGSRGARGVIRIGDADEIEDAYRYADEYSHPGDHLLVEQWLDGPQLSVEALVYEGQAHLSGVADRNYDRLDELYPFVIENGGETPSRFSPKLDVEIRELLARAAGVMKLENGSIKGDFVYHDGDLYIIEVAARLSGGYWSTFTIPKVYDVNIVREVIRIALGIPPELPQWPLRNIAWQANRFLFAPAGEVVSINLSDDVAAGLDMFKIYLNEGDVVSKVTDHTKRAGMALSIAHSRDEAIRRCDMALDKLSIITR